MKQTDMRRGARRLTALGASAAMAASALAVGFAAPASAEPVTVTTTVTDTAGNGIDGRITVYRDYGDGEYREWSERRFSSGVAGLGLEPGSYKLKFSANGYASEFFTDKPDLASADVVAVAGPMALPPVQLAPAPTITGSVTDDQGRPLPYVGVNLIGAGVDNGDFYDYTTTGKDGVFSLAATPGPYTLSVEGTSVGRKSYRFEYFNDKATMETADVFTHGGATTNVGVISLASGAVISGQVTGPGGVPLQYAEVSASLADCTSGGTCNTFTDRTDAAGNFAVEGVAPGTYQVRIDDLAGEYVSEYHADTTDYSAATLVTVAKDQRVALNAELAPRPANDPASVDLAGRVTDSAGAPVVGARVTAYSTPADRKRAEEIVTTRTNRQGYYAFTTLDAQNSRVTDDAVKLYAEPLSADPGEFSRQARWQNGERTYDAAPTTPLGTTNADLVLPVTGGISGTISSEVGEPVLRTSAYFYDADGNASYSERADYDGSFSEMGLPAGTYKVQFVDNGYNVKPLQWIGHISEWFDDVTSQEDAKTIEVKPGQVVSGINAALGATLKAVEAPSIKGRQYVGKTLTARPGTWNVRHDLTYSYEWLVGTQVVATGEQVRVAKGWTGKRLTLRVTARNEQFSGTALANTQRLGRQPKAKIKIAGNTATIKVKVKGMKAKKVKGTVLVREIVKVKPNGKIKYKKIAKSKIKKGKTRVSLKKVKGKGKHKLVFGFKFKGKKIGAAEITKKVKRKR